MPANVLADKIISELKNEIGTEGDKFDSSTPSKANKAIAKAITDYLKDNTMIAVAYVGVIPGVPPVPDPVVSDVFKIKGSCSAPSATNFDAWLMELTLNIQTGFEFDSGNLGLRPMAPAKCFLGPVPFVGSQALLGLSGIHKANEDDPQKPIWTAISTAIWTWLNTQIPVPFGCMNSNTSSTGMATTVKITVL